MELQNIFYKNVPIILKFISIPFCIIIALLSLKAFLYILNKRNNQKDVLIFYIIDFILAIFLFIDYFFINKENNIIINITCIIAFIYLFMNIGLRNNELKKLNISYTKIKKLESNNKTLSTKNDELSAFQHDFNNIVQTIGGLLAIEKYDNLKRYYNGLKTDCQLLNDMNILDSARIKNPEILSLLINKYNLAIQNGIKMNLEIFSDLSKLNSDIFQIVRILGILLDNAIEATKECSKKILNIEFKLENCIQSIKIENTYIDNNTNTEDLFKKGFSTKSGNKGLGLWKVNKIIKNNKKLKLYTFKDSDFFTQKLEIMV